MPYINKQNSDIEPIVGIQFGIFSPEEIERRSVVEITNAGTFDGNEPRIGGLFDPRMGTLENGKTCRSCGQTNHNCPGHFGHYKLARPVYYIQFFPMILNILNCICIRCSKLLLDKNANKHLLKKHGEARWKSVLNICKNIGRCGEEIEDGCGAIKPTGYSRESIARIVAQFNNSDPNATKENQTLQQVLECEYVHRLFRRISDEDVDFMGFSRYWCRPDWMICSVLAIPPPQVRPSVIQDNNQRSEDDLTHKLFEIISANNTLQDKINNNAAKHIIDDQYTVLQYHVATLVDNQIPGVAPSAQRSGRPLKSIQQRLGSKEGRIRYNIQGKRVEFSGRSVITPDPNISIEEIGVPIKIAMNLTRPERVTQYNRSKMYKLIQNGADVYPGAKTVVRKDGRIISLKHVNAKEIVLHFGDIVNRHLMDGDRLLFNRQPTLHRMSMMGHKVKVLPFNTFRLNVSVTSPYNADFDGDEMNAHIPQSYEASIELDEIAAVPKQIITPRHAKPVIGIVQDTLIGSYRLTQPNVTFNRREFMNMMMWNKHFDGRIPEAKNGRYTGHQILSKILPSLNMEMGNSRYDEEKVPDNFVKIREGQVSQGIFDKTIFSKEGKGIIHTTFKDYGPAETVHFLDCMQNTIEQFLVYNGFSVGISDLIADEQTKRGMDEKIRARKAEVENIMMQIHLDLFTNNTGKSNKDEFENRVFSALNKATEESGKIGLGSLAAENRLVSMVRAGSKGTTINIAQMLACVGQQAPEGKRIPLGFTDRTLPHYKKYDDGAEARGFVESSFIRGLSPQEFFFHAMSGREGLIDTAVKSVTFDTKIMIYDTNNVMVVKIGEWIDKILDNSNTNNIEYYPNEANMELLKLDKPVFIPTTNDDGKVTWGELTAITRHDPGEKLYEIKTKSGRYVTVTASKSLLIWNSSTKKLEAKLTNDVKIGDNVPITGILSAPPTITHDICVSKYLPKNEFLYGTDYKIAIEEYSTITTDLNKWWNESNGKNFILPYKKFNDFKGSIKRIGMDKIEKGFVYSWCKPCGTFKIPECIPLDERTGIILGLYLADGNADISSGYIQITKNNESIRTFVKQWFQEMGIYCRERIDKRNMGVSSDIRAFSVVLAKLFIEMCGKGSAGKHIPDECYGGNDSFVRGLLNGYFSGDGCIAPNGGIQSSSVSQELTEGISMMCSRIGVFAKLGRIQQKKNNVGSKNILPAYTISIRAQWARKFAEQITLINEEKRKKLAEICFNTKHLNYKEYNDIILDSITEINHIDPSKHPKMYDVTVPSTLNFGLANGLQCRDTADTGYVQRQLIKAMEDLVTQNDGTVRDAKMNIVQFHYGEDGLNSTMIEAQSLGIATLSKDQIVKEYGLDGVDLSNILTPETVREDDTEALKNYVDLVLNDQDIMVQFVNRNKDISNKRVYSPVNIERLMETIRVKFKLSKTTPTDLTPLYVLNGINRVIEKTQTYHRIWAALLRFYLAPHKIIGIDRFTKDAFDTLCELLVIKNYQARAQPGEQVGIIAAQSIGEPSTQMTLNSVDYDTNIVIMKNGKILTPEIGEFIDNYYESLPEDSDKVQRLPNNQIYIELNDGNDWKAISTDEDGNMIWTKLEAITRHPVINEDGSNTILEVELESGRTIKATKARSFLTKLYNKVISIKGTELEVGDEIPIANSLNIGEYIIKEINLREILSPNEWIYGSEMNKAIETMKLYDEKGDRHWFQSNQGKLFTVPYSRSDAFRDAINGRNTNTFKNGCVYPKRTRHDTSHIPETIQLTKEFGFFVGAYIAEGMSNSTQINITNNDNKYIEKVKSLMDEWNVGTHIVSEDRECEKTGIKGHTTSLVIHSTLLAKVMGHYFGKLSYEKTLPDWVLQASDDFVKGLVDAYISGDGCVCIKSGCVSASSVSKKLIIKIMALLARYEIFSTMSSYIPKLKKFNSVSRQYSLHILAKYSKVFAETFNLTITHKQDRLNHHFINNNSERICTREYLNDIVWDKVKSIKEISPLREWVYDLTVEKTRHFTGLNLVNLDDTFHLAGVASKSNVTRGVPRLKELLKVTQNPKAISLTIPLKKEYRDSIDKARQVAQDLELTLLKDIVLKCKIFFDPHDDESVVEEDRELIKFYNMFMTRSDEVAEKFSKWVLRLEFDRDAMFKKNITLDNVAFVLNSKFEDNISFIYSDYNSDNLVMRLRLNLDDKESTKDDLLNLKKFENKILTSIVIRGIPSIKSVSYRKDTNYYELVNDKYEQITQYILDTDGSNFVEIMNHPYVNGNAVLSSHVHDIYENLGIEAARATLLNEITTLFAEAGGVDYRHLGLLCDTMTSIGRLMSVDRYGINKNDIGPLAKASFEETEKILLKAAQFGEVDPVTGVSANIMTGQPIRGGTSFSEILFDEQAFMRLQEGLAPVKEVDEDEDDYEATEEDIENELYESAEDRCAVTNLKLNVTLGTSNTANLDEPDIEAIIIDEKD